ncbi:MAG TPA: polysaccharide deacetylase family protein [Thermoanaerobaculia bacterium]|jgi:peptidoglycan/xylan/chitin deacetylase (PgdA/CDA1 family)
MKNKRLKRALRSTLQSAPFTPIARLFAGVATCLMYHRISPGGAADATIRTRFQPNLSLYVSEQEFEKQIAFLARRHRCVSIEEAVDGLLRGNLPPRTVVITFDDGYRDNLLALPALERHRVPATIYVTSGAVGAPRPLWWDEQELFLATLERVRVEWRGEELRWDLSTPERKEQAFREWNRLFKRMTPREQNEFMELLREAARDAMRGDGPSPFLTWDDVRMLDKHPLITIGAHSVDHSVLSQLTVEELQAQIVDSRNALAEALGHSIDHFAYPFGGVEHAAEREFAAVRDAGFRSAVTTRHGHWYRASRRRIHCLPRISVEFRHSVEDLQWKLSGLDVALHKPLSAFGR